MNNLSSAGPNKFLTHQIDGSVAISNIQEPHLQEDMLKVIFDNLERSELIRIRGVCKLWNKNILGLLESKSVRKREKLDNYHKFLLFLYQNLSNLKIYPIETAIMKRDFQELTNIKRIYSEQIIPFFKKFSFYVLGSTLTDKLLNIKVIDLRYLKSLEDQIAPECRNFLDVLDLKQRLRIKDFNHIVEGLNEEERLNYVNQRDGNYTREVIKLAKESNKYFYAFSAARKLSPRLPIRLSKDTFESFEACWNEAEKVLKIISKDGNTNPTCFDGIRPSYFIECAKICLHALEKNKFKRLIKTWKFKKEREPIAMLFVIRYLKILGKNNQAVQIESLLKPEAINFLERYEQRNNQ